MGLREVDIVSGCFFLVSAELWLRLGGFRQKYFMYGEEADFCLRAAQLGARPMATGSATIIHYGGASESIPAAKRVKVLRAKAQLMNDHWSRVARLIGKMLLLSRVGVRCLGAVTLSIPGLVSRDAAQEWREVWAARATWVKGFE